MGAHEPRRRSYARCRNGAARILRERRSRDSHLNEAANRPGRAEEPGTCARRKVWLPTVRFFFYLALLETVQPESPSTLAVCYPGRAAQISPIGDITETRVEDQGVGSPAPRAMASPFARSGLTRAARTRRQRMSSRLHERRDEREVSGGSWNHRSSSLDGGIPWIFRDGILLSYAEPPQRG